MFLPAPGLRTLPTISFNKFLAGLLLDAGIAERKGETRTARKRKISAASSKVLGGGFEMKPRLQISLGLGLWLCGAHPEERAMVLREAGFD